MIVVMTGLPDAQLQLGQARLAGKCVTAGT
jgi:hypothetical protein